MQERKNLAFMSPQNLPNNPFLFFVAERWLDSHKEAPNSNLQIIEFETSSFLGGHLREVQYSTKRIRLQRERVRETDCVLKDPTTLLSELLTWETYKWKVSVYMESNFNYEKSCNYKICAVFFLIDMVCRFKYRLVNWECHCLIQCYHL